MYGLPGKSRGQSLNRRATGAANKKYWSVLHHASVLGAKKMSVSLSVSPQTYGAIRAKLRSEVGSLFPRRVSWLNLGMMRRAQSSVAWRRLDSTALPALDSFTWSGASSNGALLLVDDFALPTHVIAFLGCCFRNACVCGRCQIVSRLVPFRVLNYIGTERTDVDISWSCR